jgi:hypothetical protein
LGDFPCSQSSTSSEFVRVGFNLFNIAASYVELTHIVIQKEGA